jgi:hypothetical protein
LNNAHKAIKKAINKLGLEECSNMIHDISNQHHRWGEETIQDPLSKLGFGVDDFCEIGVESRSLANLYMLAHSFHKTVESKSHPAYVAAQTFLVSDHDFKLSSEAVIEIIAKETWRKEKFSDNPYIASLKKVMEAISRQKL